MQKLTGPDLSDHDQELREAEEVLDDPDAELTELERNWLINWLASNDKAA
jgi:hypothetical protein